ncbi:conserved Plasmodium protein, unknown function [Plasmodium ovale wallikeri]|uniref:Uncharacterized protein n=1 Tax=Plasmodium ovale wallikeri TaxID=864142 RepID=A0A1A8YM26_PLAOA|nr:conserved Plasmodium protein, unknown function [Plasmodium ovale wallikeri]
MLQLIRNDRVMLLNNLLEELLEKWKGGHINLFHACLCFHHIKSYLSKCGNRKDFFVNDISDVTLRKLLNLLQGESGNHSDNRDGAHNRYLYVAFLTFIFNLECGLLRRGKEFTQYVEETYERECTGNQRNRSKQEGKKKNPPEEENSGRNERSGKSKRSDGNAAEKEKGESSDPVEGEEERKTEITELHTQYRNVFEKIDMLVKSAMDSEGKGGKCEKGIDISVIHSEDDEFASYRMCGLYSAIKFVYLLSQCCPKIGKQYVKYVKIALHYIMNTELCTLTKNGYITHLANKTLLMIVHTHHFIIKEYEKEFFNFMYMQLGKRKEDNVIDTIEQVIVTYLKKKQCININDEVYENIMHYANDNINLFLKYEKKEYLFFFFNSIHVLKYIMNSPLSNSNDNVYLTKSVNFVNIKLNLSGIISNIYRLLEYMANATKNFLTNKKMDIYIKGDDYIHCKDETNSQYNNENILDSITSMEKKNRTYINSSIWKNNSSVHDYATNIFIYITNNVFSFFRDLVKILDSETISMYSTHFINFLKYFFIYNNVNDLFLMYLLNTTFSSYCKELLCKSPSVFEEFIGYIIHMLRIANLLTRSKLDWGRASNVGSKAASKVSVNSEITRTHGEGATTSSKVDVTETILHTLGKVKTAQHGEYAQNDHVTDVYCIVYNNCVRGLYLFLKSMEDYTNEQVKEKLLVHYEHFLIHIFDEQNNGNLNLILRDNTSTFLTLKMLSLFVKVKTLPFQKVYNIYFQLCKVEKALHTRSEKAKSFFYKNDILNNDIFIQKIKTFLLKSVDIISSDDKQFYIKRKIKMEKLKCMLLRTNEKNDKQCEPKWGKKKTKLQCETIEGNYTRKMRRKSSSSFGALDHMFANGELHSEDERKGGVPSSNECSPGSAVESADGSAVESADGSAVERADESADESAVERVDKCEWANGVGQDEEQPCSEQPCTEQPCSEQPCSEQPCTEQPDGGQPNDGQPDKGRTSWQGSRKRKKRGELHKGEDEELNGDEDAGEPIGGGKTGKGGGDHHVSQGKSKKKCQIISDAKFQSGGEQINENNITGEKRDRTGDISVIEHKSGEANIPPNRQSKTPPGKEQKRKKKPKKIYKNSNVDKNSDIFKELTDNIKMVSSADAINSLMHMKRSILNDL